MKIVKCEWCGKEFEKITNNMLYCCPECRYEATKKKLKIRYEEKSAKKPGANQKEIIRVMRIAAEHGMSYGKYVNAAAKGMI